MEPCNRVVGSRTLPGARIVIGQERLRAGFYIGGKWCLVFFFFFGIGR